MVNTLLTIVAVAVVAVIVAIALFYVAVYLLFAFGFVSATWSIGRWFVKSSEANAPLKDLKTQIRYAKALDAEEDRQRRRQIAIEQEDERRKKRPD